MLINSQGQNISVIKNYANFVENKFEEVSVMWVFLELLNADIH